MAVAFLSYIKYIRCLGCIKNRQIVSLISERSIMTTRPRLEKVLEDLRKNPYFDKYAEKIAKLQQTNTEEFLERISEKERKIQEEKGT